jgi:hypothetical protein
VRISGKALSIKPILSKKLIIIRSNARQRIGSLAHKGQDGWDRRLASQPCCSFGFYQVQRYHVDQLFGAEN